jgi:hypothetical protein
MNANIKYTRIDHTDYLIHFTKDSKDWNYEDSYKLFIQIILEGHLKESSHFRLGDIPSICFTEASYSALAANYKLNKKYFSRYSPFGFMFAKRYIYKLGGLPVIYSPREDFEKDNDKTNWRTVAYYPLSPIRKVFRDYTWEREWRIKPDDGKLGIDPQYVWLVFPSKIWAEKFRIDYINESKNSSHIRNCLIINYDQFLAMGEYDYQFLLEQQGDFSWILLNMDCDDIPVPK